MKTLTNSAFACLRAMTIGGGLAGVMALQVAAQSVLPAPYVSRALDAVLIGVDSSVQQAFGLAEDETGVLVLAVEPGGVAEGAGLVPGEVISTVLGRSIADPITLDAVVFYSILNNSFDFGLDGWSDGQPANYTTSITLESYTTEIEVTTVSSWSSYSYEGFSYEEYTAEYSAEISESYESAEASIEETIASDDFASEEIGAEASDDDGMAAEDGTEAGDEGAADDGSDAGGDEGGGDEGGTDEGE